MRPAPISSIDESRGMSVENLSIYYGARRVLKDVSLSFHRREVTAVVGPSGCGKSSLLLAMNRLIETVPGARVEGRISLDGVDISSPGVALKNLRRRVGLIFQKPNPFPLSIYENVALAPREHGLGGRHELRDRVEKSLRAAALWDEVKDRLNHSALSLSGGQQQRLCLARAISLHPEALLMDEPCSSLDPVSGARVEDLIRNLSESYTVLVVTHNLSQARRISHRTAFFHVMEGCGELVEFGPTDSLFNSPAHPVTSSYVSGRVG